MHYQMLSALIIIHYETKLFTTLQSYAITYLEETGYHFNTTFELDLYLSVKVILHGKEIRVGGYQ